MLDQDVTILNQIEDSSFVDGVNTPIIRVTFKVAKHGPFSVKVPKDGLTKQQRDDAVNAFAAQVRIP